MGILVLHGYYYTSFLLFVFLHFLQRSNCATVVVDGVTQWKNPTANIGDTIIFKHKNQYNLYIFRTEEAFKSCNFNQAIPLSNVNSTTSYTWHPSRIGSFYFGFYNKSNIPCNQGQKLTIKISTTTTTQSPSPSPSPQPHSPTPEMQPPATPGSGGGGGGIVSSSPAYPWPFQPREKQGASASPGPAYTSVGISPMAAAKSPAMGSMPFINSNPAVPLPTGEVDSATIQPLPTSAHPSSQGLKVVASNEGVLSLCYVIIVAVMVI